MRRRISPTSSRHFRTGYTKSFSWTGIPGVLLLPGVDAVHDQVRPADHDVLVDLLQRLVDQVVEPGVALVVPAGPRVVPEALELVPDDEVAYVRIALGDGRGQIGEVLVVLGRRRGLQGGLAPVGV